jgi:hypothetical protein
MQAANEGTQESGAAKRVQSIGIRVELPFEQTVNPFVEKAFEHQTLLYPLAPVRADVRCLHRRTGRHWHGAQIDHDLAAAAGAYLHGTISLPAMWTGLVDWATQMMLRPGNS